MTICDSVTAIISTMALVFAAVSLVQGLIEYRKQGIAKRTEMFLQMRSRLREDPTFSKICSLLETDNVKLREIPLVERDRFIGFFEELALMKNSGLMNNHVALYMFGYFAIRCYDSRNFWYDLNRDQPLWSLFMDFAVQMKVAQSNFRYNRSDFRL